MKHYVLFDNTGCDFNCSGVQVTVIPVNEREGYVEQADKCDACPQGICSTDQKEQFIKNYKDRQVHLPDWFEGTWYDASRMNRDMTSTKIKPGDLVLIIKL